MFSVWIRLLPSDLTCSFQQAEEDCTKAISLDKKVSGETWNFATNISELFNFFFLFLNCTQPNTVSKYYFRVIVFKHLYLMKGFSPYYRAFKGKSFKKLTLKEC